MFYRQIILSLCFGLLAAAAIILISILQEGLNPFVFWAMTIWALTCSSLTFLATIFAIGATNLWRKLMINKMSSPVVVPVIFSGLFGLFTPACVIPFMPVTEWVLPISVIGLATVAACLVVVVQQRSASAV